MPALVTPVPKIPLNIFLYIYRSVHRVMRGLEQKESGVRGILTSGRWNVRYSDIRTVKGGRIELISQRFVCPLNDLLGNRGIWLRLKRL
jgi:hypothetical protein